MRGSEVNIQGIRARHGKGQGIDAEALSEHPPLVVGLNDHSVCPQEALTIEDPLAKRAHLGQPRITVGIARHRVDKPSPVLSAPERYLSLYVFRTVLVVQMRVRFRHRLHKPSPPWMEEPDSWQTRIPATHFYYPDALNGDLIGLALVPREEAYPM